MTALPAGWKLKDPDHAVRICRALVEQGEDLARNNPIPKKEFHYLIALVEGAKAVLTCYKDAWDTNKHGEPGPDDATIAYWRGRREQADLTVKDSAQTYAPRMAEAGMEVPE